MAGIVSVLQVVPFQKSALAPTAWQYDSELHQILFVPKKPEGRVSFDQLVPLYRYERGPFGLLVPL